MIVLKIKLKGLKKKKRINIAPRENKVISFICGDWVYQTMEDAILN